MLQVSLWFLAGLSKADPGSGGDPVSFMFTQRQMVSTWAIENNSVTWTAGMQQNRFVFSSFMVSNNTMKAEYRRGLKRFSSVDEASAAESSKEMGAKCLCDFMRLRKSQLLEKQFQKLRGYCKTSLVSTLPWCESHRLTSPFLSPLPLPWRSQLPPV